MTPTGILQIAAFVTLCEAYMGIEPHFDLWNYFFRVRRPKNNAPLATSEGAVIYVKTGGNVTPYFELPLPKSMKGWRGRWFLVRNDGEDPLPEFTGRTPTPFHNWEYGVAAKDRHKLDLALSVIKKLQDGGLTGVHLLRTFFARRLHPLRVRRHRMSRYLGPSDPDRPSIQELSDDQVTSRVRQVIDNAADPRPPPGPSALRDGMREPWVSVVVCYLVAFRFLRLTRVFQGFGTVVSRVRGSALPSDVKRRAVNRAHGESKRAQKQAAKAKQSARMAAKQRGEDTPSSSYSDDEESSESAASSRESSPRPDVPPPNVVLQRQSGGAPGGSRPKRARTGSASGSGTASTQGLVPVRQIRAKCCISCFGWLRAVGTYLFADRCRCRRAARRPPPRWGRCQATIRGIGAPRPRSPGMPLWGYRPGKFPDPGAAS